MRVYRDLDDVPPNLPGTVVSLGVFDGVHRGHQELLSTNLRAAKRRGLLATALTFDPHPALVHRPQVGVEMIASLEDRLALLDALGMDLVIVQPYSLDWARMTAEEFVRDVFVDTLKAQLIVAGEDVRFGRDNAGDAAFLQAQGEKHGFDVEILDDITGDISGRRWSSTWVRELLAAGDVRGAEYVLGRPHRLRGVVQHGYKRGRELGYPTANLDPDGLGVVPADGVYAGWLIRPEDDPGPAPLPHGHPKSHPHARHPAAISIGTNPQFSGPTRTVEAHVLGRGDLDLYGEEVVVELVERIRDMGKFKNLDALLERMRKDVVTTAGILDVPVPGPIDPESVTAGT